MITARSELCHCLGQEAVTGGIRVISCSAQTRQHSTSIVCDVIWLQHWSSWIAGPLPPSQPMPLVQAGLHSRV